MRTVRYTSADIEGMIGNPNFYTLAVNLKDKFGDYGLISVVIVNINQDNAFIDTWVMSCRVLKRGVEQEVMRRMLEELQLRGIKILRGEYIPTEKNKMVSSLLRDMGMPEVGEGKFELEVG